MSYTTSFPAVSVIIPAKNEESNIAHVILAIERNCPAGINLEIVVVDDGSTDGTVAAAQAANARVVELEPNQSGGNPAAARNRGAAVATGDPLIFLDADCVPGDDWLPSILAAHDSGVSIIGGSLDLPPGLSAIARCDYYCGWYLTNSRRPGGFVPHHPPPNISVRREPFFSTTGFTEEPPFNYTNEERRWQAELQNSGHQIYFEPKAMAYHFNRPGLTNLLRRNYRWGYTAIEIKSQTSAARMAWLYRYPRLLILATPLLAIAHTVYILGCWIRVGLFEPVLMAPLVFASRLAYVAGMAVGGIQWLKSANRGSDGERPPPRWV